MKIRTTRWRLATSALAAMLAVAGVAATASAAEPPTTDEHGVQIVLGDELGNETLVTADELEAIVRDGGLQLDGDGGGDSLNAHSQYEGTVFRSLKLYFNKDETNRIAAGAGSCTAILSKIPHPIAVALDLGCAALTVWAGSAIMTGSCVGVAKSPVPLTPYPIYHNKEWCF